MRGKQHVLHGAAGGNQAFLGMGRAQRRFKSGDHQEQERPAKRLFARVPFLGLRRLIIALDKRLDERFGQQMPPLGGNDHQAPWRQQPMVGRGARGRQNGLDLVRVRPGIAQPSRRDMLARMNQRHRSIEHFLVISRTHAAEYISFRAEPRSATRGPARRIPTNTVGELHVILDMAHHFYNTGNMKISSATECLAALGHETRLAIFRLLVQAGAQGVSAGLIGEQLKIPAPTLSFHLAHLSRVGLIKGRQESRFIYYAADYRVMDELLSYLTENCCQGGQCLPRVATIAAPKKRSLAKASS